MAKSYWVVMIPQKFEDMEFQSVFSLPTALQVDTEPYRYLPVFETYEAAVQWNNGTEYITEVAGG